MVHLAFFDNFTIPPPSSHTMLGRCAQSVPLEATLYGGEGGGEGARAKFGKKGRFYHRAGGDDENIATFQGVPYNFDQDYSCLYEIGLGFESFLVFPVFQGLNLCVYTVVPYEQMELMWNRLLWFCEFPATSWLWKVQCILWGAKADTSGSYRLPVVSRTVKVMY